LYAAKPVATKNSIIEVVRQRGLFLPYTKLGDLSAASRAKPQNRILAAQATAFDLDTFVTPD
jgi:hypothetical protein